MQLEQMTARFETEFKEIDVGLWVYLCAFVLQSLVTHNNVNDWKI